MHQYHPAHIEVVRHISKGMPVEIYIELVVVYLMFSVLVYQLIYL